MVRARSFIERKRMLMTFITRSAKLGVCCTMNRKRFSSSGMTWLAVTFLERRLPRINADRFGTVAKQTQEIIRHLVLLLRIPPFPTVR